MNQDGLENLFGCVKLCCQVGVSPTPTQFRTGFTTMVINNFCNKYSIHSNCEDDMSIPLTVDFHKFLMDYKDKEQSSYLEDIVLDQQFSEPNQSNHNSNLVDTGEISKLENIGLDPLFTVPDFNFVEDEAMSYLSSEICRNLIQITDCQDCIDNLQTTEISDSIIIRNPSAIFKRNFKYLYCAISNTIPNLCSEKSIAQKMLSNIESINMDDVGCPEHNTMILSKLKLYSVRHGIISFCNNINSLLSGNITIVPPKPNHIQDQALIFKEKRKHIGKHSDIFKKI